MTDPGQTGCCLAVIGAGLAGLTVANHLEALGHQVVAFNTVSDSARFVQLRH
jgi:monoamine oxidase